MLKPEWEQGEKLRAAPAGKLDISLGCTLLQKVSGISETSYAIMPEICFYVLFSSQTCPS